MKNLLIAPLFVFVACFATHAHAQWQPGGNGVCTYDSLQSEPGVCSDGAGGAIFAWLDQREQYPPNQFGARKVDVYVQRLNASGIPQWTTYGVLICAATASMSSYPCLASDGSGGAIITWHDYRGTTPLDIYAQRVNGAGVAQWVHNGVAISTAVGSQSNPEIVTDGAGGAIVAWLDNDHGVAAQRINAAGVVQWATNGIALNNHPSDSREVHIVSDGVGGAMASWTAYRGPFNQAEIYAQHVAGDGSISGPSTGIPVCTAPNDQTWPALVASGAGTVVAWSDQRNWPDWDIYAQRLDATGAPQWALNGIPVCVAAGPQYFPALATDGAGGAIIAWEDHRASDGDIYARRVINSGVVQWTPNGQALCDVAGNQTRPWTVDDGTGGAIVAWSDARGASADIFAQRIQSTGATQWADDGIGVETDPGDQYMEFYPGPGIVTDMAGGAIIAFTDLAVHQGDIFAEHVPADGVIPTGVGPTRAPTLFALSDNYPNPFSAGTSFDMTLERESHVHVDVFDAAGRRVRTHDMGRLKAGPSRFAFDGLDERSRALPSGVYFLRVNAGSESVTKKMVIAR